MFVTIFITVSIITTIILIMNSILLPLFRYLKRRKFIWTTNDGQYWAVVTGATDGIGFEFARQLARKGYNLMMISRNEEKLALKSTMILEQYPSIKIETLAVDFQYQDIYQKIEQFLRKHQDIFILVNNVGTFTINGQLFNNETSELHQQMMDINLTSTIRMTELILPKMLSKRRGLIINVSSMITEYSGYKQTMYAATKSFQAAFSRSLMKECQSKNVLIFTLLPATVASSTLTFKISLLVPTAQTYVYQALRSINWTVKESYGYVPHTILAFTIKFFAFIFGQTKANDIIDMIFENVYKKKLKTSLDIGNLLRLIRLMSKCLIYGPDFNNNE
ncbi:very-long-chain 3-oxoacyl-CoA reductase-B isoform X2 [Dermatophagoides farinae]|uniref:very-long-chain 3-oxoacyl-CoA reductase-B isoform X2 n=1 Tax=Dermatophagoides farinae TaxID=6954 RepID=UPI003F6350E3